MTVRICHKPEGYETLDTQWDYLIRAFGIDPVAGFLSDTASIGSQQVVVVQPQNGTYVQGETSLVGFQHPEDCCYLFGMSNGHMPAESLVGLNVVAKVYIPTQPTWDFYAPQAAAIVLWDRIRSRGSIG